MVKWATLFGVAVLAGFVGARVRPAANPQNLPLESDSHPGYRATSWKRGDLLRWIGENEPRRGAGVLPNPVSPDFSAWSAEELRMALDDAVADPSTVFWRVEAPPVIGALIAEWMSRDPDAVVAWFEGLDSDSVKRHLASSLGAYWPQDRAEEGLAIVIRNRAFFDTSAISSWAFVQMAIESAARRGPAAVDAVLAQLRTHKLDSAVSYRATFPEGFDFSSLAASPEAAALLAERNGFFAGQWMKQDPEGAFNYFKDDLVLNPGVHLRMMFLDVMPGGRTFDPAAGIARAEWLASRIASLAPDERLKIAKDSVDALAASPAVLGAFAAALADPGLRDDLSVTAVNRLLPAELLDYLEATGDAGQRLQLLEAATEVRVGGSRSSLSRRDERMLRERLATWNAPSERIETMIRSLKGEKE